MSISKEYSSDEKACTKLAILCCVHACEIVMVGYAKKIGKVGVLLT